MKSGLLTDYVLRLSMDRAELLRFTSSAEAARAAMADAGLSAAEQEVLLSGNQRRIGEAIARDTVAATAEPSEMPSLEPNEPAEMPSHEPTEPAEMPPPQPAEPAEMPPPQPSEISASERSEPHRAQALTHAGAAR